MSTSNPRYDDALPAVVSIIVQTAGLSNVLSGQCRFLRDAAGVITTIHDEGAIAPETRTLMEAKLRELGSYIDPDWPVTTPAELYDTVLANKQLFQRTEIALADRRTICVHVLDRRIVGFDWLSRVAQPITGAPPIVVFASLKGGVGRSTALSISAQDLSLAGLRVLAIDLDLEAPGLGAFLLPPENRPEYGSLDFYVERGLSKFSGNDFAQLMEASPYFVGGAPVYVVPAFGTASQKQPVNVLGKLARAYVEDQSLDGDAVTFLDRTRALIRGLIAVRDFDVVLVDARAGLHETAAAPLLGIGADVLLFGVYQKQTFEGYLPLLAHIAAFTPNAEELLPRLRMVHSKAALTSGEETEGFRDEAHALFAQTLYGKPAQSTDEFETQQSTWYNLSDPDGPHFPWQIGESANHRLFDLIRNPNQLDEHVYADAYSDFVEQLRTTILARLEDGLEKA